MAQEKIKIDNTLIRQPDSGLAYGFETTYTADSNRDESGDLHETMMFTVESLGYAATGLSSTEMSQILQLVVGRRFQLRYFSPYYGAWRTDTFYVGKGSLAITYLTEGEERYDGLAFNMVGVHPIVQNNS